MYWSEPNRHPFFVRVDGISMAQKAGQIVTNDRFVDAARF
jgi:hypothetical protein